MDTEDIRKYAKSVRHRTVEQSVPEHEILLVFNNDVDAEAFDEWWATEGKEAFIQWAQEWKP